MKRLPQTLHDADEPLHSHSLCRHYPDEIHVAPSYEQKKTKVNKPIKFSFIPCLPPSPAERPDYCLKHFTTK